MRRAATLLSTAILVAGCTTGPKEGRGQSAREAILPPAYLARGARSNPTAFQAVSFQQVRFHGR